MSYTVPEFNLTVNVWHFPHKPPDPPAIIIKANLAWGRRISLASTAFVAGTTAFMQLLVPPGTDLRTPVQNGPGPDLFEAPAGSGRFYESAFVDDIGKGFPNEHRIAIVFQSTYAG